LPKGYEFLLAASAVAATEKDRPIGGKDLKPEEELIEKLEALSPVGDLNEVGARIHAALKQDVKPSWIFYVMAGNYWRLLAGKARLLAGTAENTRNCYLHALSKVPERFRDVVLTNLAAMLYRLDGDLDNALNLVQSASAIDDKDPDINFLLGNLLMAKKRYGGAVEAFERVMKMLPTYHGIKDALVAAQCFNLRSSNPFCDKNGGGCLGATAAAASDLAALDGGEDGGSVFGGQSILSKFINCREDGSCVSLTDQEIAQELEKLTLQTANLKKATAGIVNGNGGAKKSSTCKAGGGGNGAKKCNKSVNEKQTPPEIVFMAKTSELTDVTIVEITDPELQDNGVFVVGTIATTKGATASVGLTAKTVGGLNAGVAKESGELPQLYKRLHKRARKGCGGGGGGGDTTAASAASTAVVGGEGGVATAAAAAASTTGEEAEFVSTWLSIGAKSIFLKDEHDDSSLLVHLQKEPKCMKVPISLVLPDHLPGIKRRSTLISVAELGLSRTFQTLTGDFSLDISVDLMATKVALSLEEQPYSWIVSAIASVYWRIEGNPEEAIECLRHSIFYAPKNSRDIGLISLANVLLSAQLYNDAIVVANQAYEISGNKFAIVPFTLANIYAMMGDADRAATFYEESIQLQPDFSEAKTRLAKLQCR